MKHGEYTGPIECLYGKTAILRSSPDGDYVLAQFDDRGLTTPATFLELTRECDPDIKVGYGWYVFPNNHFEVLPK